MELLAEIPATSPWVIDDFSLTLRLLLAMLLGSLIGLEREQANHPAGLRTPILVCIGSALIMLLSIYGFSSFVYEGNVRVDPARLATAVITGLVFLAQERLFLQASQSQALQRLLRYGLLRRLDWL